MRGRLGGGVEDGNRHRFAHWDGKRRMQDSADLKGIEKLYIVIQWQWLGFFFYGIKNPHYL